MEQGLPRGRCWAIADDDDVKEVQHLLKALGLIDRRLRKQIIAANVKHEVVSARINSNSTVPDLEAQNVLAWKSHTLGDAKRRIHQLIGDVQSSLDMVASGHGTITLMRKIDADLDEEVDSSSSDQ